MKDDKKMKEFRCFDRRMKINCGRLDDIHVAHVRINHERTTYGGFGGKTMMLEQ